MDTESIPELPPVPAPTKVQSESARRSKEWREKHPERAKAYDVAYKRKNHARMLQKQREYNERHAERKRAEANAWRAAHVEQARANARDWQDEHPAAKLAHDAKYRESHREELRAKNQANTLKRREDIPGYREAELARLHRWNEEHPEERRAITERRRARLVEAPINDFTRQDWRALCKASGYRCAYCHEKFAFKDLTMDHITPLSKGGSHTLSNIIPACQPCNSRKNNKGVPTPVQPFLLL